MTEHGRQQDTWTSCRPLDNKEVRQTQYQDYDAKVSQVAMQAEVPEELPAPHVELRKAVIELYSLHDHVDQLIHKLIGEDEPAAMAEEVIQKTLDLPFVEVFRGAPSEIRNVTRQLHNKLARIDDILFDPEVG